MPEILEQPCPDGIFQIYNQSSGNELLVVDEKDYNKFLFKLKKYISHVCNVYSYILMPNHYHLVVRIKPENKLCNYYDTKTRQVKGSRGWVTQN